MKFVSPRLIVLNQSSGLPIFGEWLKVVSREVESVELWTGSCVTFSDSQVVVKQGPAYDRTSVWSRLRTWLAYTVWAIWELFWLRERVPVIVVTNPPLMVWAIWLFSRIRSQPYALLEWDIYPDILQPMGLLSNNQMFYRCLHWLHGQALHGAVSVVTLGDEMASVLQSSTSAEISVQVVPNWVNAEWLRPQPRAINPFVQMHELCDKFVVLYSGNLGTTHAIETIVAVAKILCDDDRFKFVVIGKGSKRELVESTVSKGQTPNILLLPYQPNDNLPWTLSCADVAIVTLGQGYEGLSMPSKTYSLMATGNALLGISCSPNDLALTIKRHKCGRNFLPDETTAIADWLRYLADNQDELNRLRVAARQAVEEYYSADLCIAQLTSAFRPLWAGKK